MNDLQTSGQAGLHAFPLQFDAGHKFHLMQPGCTDGYTVFKLFSQTRFRVSFFTLKTITRQRDSSSA